MCSWAASLRVGDEAGRRESTDEDDVVVADPGLARAEGPRGGGRGGGATCAARGAGEDAGPARVQPVRLESDLCEDVQRGGPGPRTAGRSGAAAPRLAGDGAHAPSALGERSTWVSARPRARG